MNGLDVFQTENVIVILVESLEWIDVLDLVHEFAIGILLEGKNVVRLQDSYHPLPSEAPE